MSYPLDSYFRNVPGICDELEALLDGECREAADMLVRSKGDGVLSMSRDEKRAAISFLGKTQGQRARSLAKLDASHAALLVIRARFLGLMGVRILKIATDLQLMPGCGYRAAAVRCAESALEARVLPSLEEVLGR